VYCDWLNGWLAMGERVVFLGQLGFRRSTSGSVAPLGATPKRKFKNDPDHNYTLFGFYSVQSRAEFITEQSRAPSRYRNSTHPFGIEIVRLHLH
jgi:hypothetical protein